MKLYRRILTGALAALLTSSLFFAGCGKQEDAPRYDYDLSEYLKLDSYTGLEIEDFEAVVEEEEVEKMVTMARSTYATFAETQNPVAKSNQVNIDYTGYMDGKPFEGGSAQGADLTIGSGMFIDGFEDGLVGAKVGETVTLDLHFPDPYPNNTALSGKAVQFVVKINKVFEQALPAYTDAFVKEHYGFDTIEAFEADLRAALASQKEYERIRVLSQRAWDAVIAKAEIIKYPEKEYNELYNYAVQYHTDLAEREGISMNEYVANNYDMAVSEFTDSLKTMTEDTILQELILQYIVREQGFSVTDEEYQIRGEDYVAYYGLKSLEELEQYWTKEELRDSMLYDMVLEYLVDNAVLK